MSGSSTQGNPDLQLQGAAGVLGRPGLTALIWTCFGSATCMVITRLAVRWRQNRKLLIDDYWIILSLLSFLTLCIIQTIQSPVLWRGAEWLAGTLIPQSAEELVYTQTELVRWTLPIATVFWTVLWCVKASFLALFYRLVKPNVVLRRCWYAIVVFVALSYIGLGISTPFVCDPPTDYFRGKLTRSLSGDCTTKKEQWTQVFLVGFTTAVDIFTDLLIMALPIALLPSLQLSLKKRIGLGVCFCLALLTISFAVIRMAQVTNGDSNTIELIGYATWSIVECTVAIIVGTLPPLKSLLSRRGSKSSGSDRVPIRAMFDSNEIRPQNKRTTTSEVSPSNGSGKNFDVESNYVEREGIYVQKTFDTCVGATRESHWKDDDDEAAIIREIGS